MRIIIIGAGVVGCAIAKELSESNSEVHILEKNSKTGEGVTSRNSGVIHAGLYYPPHSLKARLCIEGRGLLYDWCEKKGVPHRKTGKMIVASLAEEEALRNLYNNAISSGVLPSDLRSISKKEIQRISPHIQGDIALHSLQSGIVDAEALCHSFYVDAAHRGALFHFNCEVTKIERSASSTLIHTSRGDLEADIVINAAGLCADDIAKLAGIDRYAIYPWRGDYFKVNLPYLIDILVYPVRKPHATGLGIHLTIDLNSQTFLGPDSEPSHSKEDFSERPEKLMKFYEAASDLLSGLKPEMLTYETCGIRPKLRSFDSNEEKDFIISEDLPGFFNLIGIESPGLTASLAIVRHVKKMM